MTRLVIAVVVAALLLGKPLLIVIAVVAWVLRCVFVPFAPCLVCRGSGNNPFSSGRRRGRCWWCRGRRERTVLGARAVRRIIHRRGQR